MRILVVEDDAKVGLLLFEGLSAEGFDVELAADGQQALDKAAAADFDLILLDYLLPKRSGLEVASTLRAGGTRIPILMLTARDSPEDLRASLAAGANDLMAKPFRFDDLIRRIRSLVPDSVRPR
jgi:two-component system response regulator QseB